LKIEEIFTHYTKGWHMGKNQRQLKLSQRNRMREKSTENEKGFIRFSPQCKNWLLVWIFVG